MTHVGQLSRRTSDTSKEAPEVLLARGHAGLARAALTQSQRLLAGPSARSHSYPTDTRTRFARLLPSVASPCGLLRPPALWSVESRTHGPRSCSHGAHLLPPGNAVLRATTITNAGTRDRHPKVTRSCCGSFLRTAPRSLVLRYPHHYTQRTH